MAVTTARHTDLSQTLATILEGVDGVRPYWYVSDAVRPPAVVIGQPDVDYTDTASGMCAASWTYPLTIVATRADDRTAQVTLARLLADLAGAINAADVDGVLSMDPLNARPLTGVLVAGQELPAYLLIIRIRA